MIVNADIPGLIIVGFERLAAWSDLLDQINVYPVADGDTGRNLVITLASLRHLDSNRQKTIHSLLLNARGNSGNIAARFFSGFLMAMSVEDIPNAVFRGRELAWKAVNNPRDGTMLTLIDAFTESVGGSNSLDCVDWFDGTLKKLEEVVVSTLNDNPKCKKAGVVDSGALGMFIFLEGFIYSLYGKTDMYVPITDRFHGMLEVASEFYEDIEDGYCVDVAMKMDGVSKNDFDNILNNADNIVRYYEGDFVKLHFHTGNIEEMKSYFNNFGNQVKLSYDNLGNQITRFKKSRKFSDIHIMTDAAGSLTKDDAFNLGITLLDSYIVLGDRSIPETYCDADELYQVMKRGIKVSTSQASAFERYQFYESVMNRFDKVLYICVGSVFTGNYDVALKWKNEHDPDDRFVVLDSTAASGRLALIALTTAQYAVDNNSFNEVVDYAKAVIDKCEEYVFLDTLKYLAAGGRLSKSTAFLGDMFRKKPVISPTFNGAKKVGIVRDRIEQIDFAFEKIEKAFTKNSSPLIMLEYSDNALWVESIKNLILKKFPQARIILQPLSLTSGVHMGPGTWAVAFVSDA